MKIIFTATLIVVSTILGYSQPSNDNQVNAIDVSTLINTCSTDAAYTTLNATSDGAAATCWNTSPNYNVWFSFVATTGQINITVDRGGSKGTLRRANLALYDSDGTTQLSCNRYVGDNDDVSTGYIGLTPSNTYYIAVDNNYSGYRGTFSLCLSDAVDYDFFEGAIDVSPLVNSCSSDAAYTTIGATADQSAASTWNTSPNYNRWFRFQATTTAINITVDRGGSQGTMRRAQLALWDDGLVEITSNRYVGDNDDVSIGHVGLTVGEWYYISVDNNYSGYRGTFSLCLDDNVDYDYFEGSLDISSIINTCSADGAYTTIGATSDRNAASTWNTSPNYNRWFRFQATTSSINVTVDRGGSQGTMRRAQLAIWDKNLVELASNRYVNDNDDVNAGYGLLTIGKWYYISVDNNYSGYRGTFTLCLDDNVDYDYFDGAIDLTSIIDNCSADAEYTTIGATGDKMPASTWNTAPNYNRWFKFQATSFAINVNINRGGSLGTIRRVNLAIWEEDGETEVSSNRYVADNDNVFVGSTDLVPGNWYFISVDNNYSGYRGTFTICLDDDVDYDFYEGATTLTNLTDWYSADGAYTTTGATGDKNAASTWNTSPNYNRWFKFQATTTSFNIQARRGGVLGTARRLQVAIWQEDGITEIASNRYVADNDNVSINATGLTIGNWYYVSIDNNYSGYRGTFSLYVNDTPDYDFYEGAIELADINNWCSADAEYTTSGATGDQNAASCWNTSPTYNRWFKFQAVTDGIQVTTSRGGSLGTIRRINLALWEADGTTQIDCNRYVADNDNVTVNSNSLTPGSWYYVSVDNNYSGYRGTFTLCVDDSPSYDYKDGALELTDLDNWCSADAEFTTSGATGDESAASCWNTAPTYNRWFKFNAIHHTATIDVTRGGALGTVRRLNVSLLDKDGVEVACSRYAADNDNIQIVQGSLIVGEDYFISVDNNYSGYRGTFTLCVNNVSTDQYYAIADGNWNIPATWSKTEGGPAAADTPGSANKVHIKGYDVTVTGTEDAATIDITVENDATSLTVNGGSAVLTVSGEMNFVNNGNDLDGNITISGGGYLSAISNLTVSRNGGANAFGIDIANLSYLSVGNDLTIVSDAGSINNTNLVISGNGALSIENDLLLDYNAGTDIEVILNNSSAMTVARDINFDTGSAGTIKVESNNNSMISLGRDMVRNATPYGVFEGNNTSTLVLNSNTYLQTLAENAGSGGDDFTYQNVTINNSRVSTPQITLEGDVVVLGTLTMTTGNVSTGSSTLTLGSSTGNIGTLSHTSGTIVGTFEKWVNHATATDYSFPVGTNQNHRPIDVSFNDTPTGSIIASFVASDPGISGLPLLDNGITYYDTYSEGYWTLSTANTLSSSDYDLSLNANGFDDYAITANTTLFTRPDSGSDWAGNGTQAAPSGATINRENVTTLDAEYSIVDNSCIDATSAISGEISVPEFEPNKEYFVTSTPGYTYTWTVNGGAIESGNGTNLIQVNWGAATAGSVSVTADNQGLCSAPAVMISVDVYAPIVSNGTGGGDWDLVSTWAGGVVPTSTDNVEILVGDAVTMNSDRTIREFLLNGSLDNNGFVLTVTNDYIVNGTHTSTGDDKVFISGVLTEIGGTGTLDLGGRFQIISGNKFILSTSDLTISSGDLYVANDITVFNNGSVTLSTGELQGGNAGSVWQNRPFSSLYSAGADASAIMSTGTLNAGFSNNTVFYNRAGTQSIKVPQNAEYFNLVLSSTTSTLLGEISILGDLTTNNIFDPNSNNFEVEGSWTNNGTFIPGTTTVTLSGIKNQVLGGTFYNLTLNKTLGSLNPSSNITVTNVLDLTSKNIVLGSNDLIITNSSSAGITNGNGTSYIVTEGTGRVIWDVAVGNSMAFPVGDSDDYSPFTFTLNSGTLSSASLNVRVVNGVHPNNPGASYISRYWVVENTGITSPDYNASYVYDDSDLVGTEGEMRPIKYSGGWTSSGTLTAGTNTLAWNNITSFSDFSGGSDVTPLPVEMIFFSVEENQNQAVLTWATAVEINNDYFSVERSSDGLYFETIGKVSGVGNSNEVINYSFVDKNPYSGFSYYRLKQTDFDEQFEYSELILLIRDEQLNSFIQFYPNPATANNLTLKNTGKALDNLTIELMSLSGKVVFVKELASFQQNELLPIGSNSIAAGTYILLIKGDTDIMKQKVIISE